MLNARLPLVGTVWMVTLLVAAGGARAAFVTEYFNNYGTGSGSNSNSSDDVDIAGLNGGSGWSGAWTGSNGPEYYSSSSPYGNSLTFGATGYDNSANETTAGQDGLARRQQGGGGNTNGAIAYRPFAGMTGTVWVSALVAGNSTTPEMILWLDEPGDVAGNRDYIGIRYINVTNGIRAAVMTNGTVDVSNSTSFSGTMTYLIIAKIGMNVAGGNDRLDFWAKTSSSDVSNEALLGTPLYSKSGGDFFGATFDGVGMSFNINGSRMDAIRVSNDTNAFSQVVGVPEPASLALIGVGALALLRRR